MWRSGRQPFFYCKVMGFCSDTGRQDEKRHLTNTMSLAPLPKEMPDVMAICRHKFDRVFDMHGIKTGSPEDLTGFMEKLRTNPYFAMDFWDIAHSAGRADDGGVSQAEIQEIVVRCVGGPEARDTDPNVQEIQRVLNENLAADVQEVDPGQHTETLGDGQRDEREKAVAESGMSSDADGELPDLSSGANGPAYTVGSGDAEEEHAARFIYSRSRQMGDALARLEINSNALKLQLETIDDRMSRIEPQIKSMPSILAASTTSEKVEDQSPKSAVDDQKAQAAPVPDPAVQNTLWVDGRGRIIAAVAVLLLVAVSLWALWYHSHDQAAYRVDSSPANGMLSGPAENSGAAGSIGKPGQFTTANGVRDNAPATAHLPPSAAGTRASRPSSQMDNSPQRGEGAGFSGNAEATTAPEGRMAGGSTEPAGPGAVPAEVGAASEGTSGAQNDSSSMESAGVSSRLSERRRGRDVHSAGTWGRGITVSSGVMAANLIESRPPDYPRLAKLAHIQGPVVLQVFISRRGTVDHINAVKGHRLLRSAAKNAVKHWRYRPYLLNGRPIEVATMVTVNFNLGS